MSMPTLLKSFLLVIILFNFLAKDEYIYSKITTITPLYVLVNHTKQLLVAV